MTDFTDLIARAFRGYQFVALAVAVNAATVLFVIVTRRGLLVSIIEAGTTAFLSIGFLYVAYKLSSTDFTLEGCFRVTGGSLLCGTIAMVIATILIASPVAEGYQSSDDAFVIFFAWVWGAAFGSPLSYYYERIRQQNKRLTAAINESSVLNRQLSISRRIMSHNLRNNLTVIMGFTEQMLHHSLSREQISMLEEIDEATGELQSTMETFFTMQEALDDEQRETFDLPIVIRDIVSMSGVAESPARVELSLPESSVVIAHQLLPAAIQELIANAIDHNDPSELRLDITVNQSVDAMGVARLEIKDNGVGLHPDDRQPIEDEHETPLKHTHGLGLWFVRTVIDQSGGAIHVTDNDPCGTRFIIELQASSAG